MVETILDLEDKIQELIDTFEKDNKVAVTAIHLNRKLQDEENIGEPIVKLNFIVPYTLDR